MKEKRILWKILKNSGSKENYVLVKKLTKQRKLFFGCSEFC